MSQGSADGIFAVAKLVKVICLTKFYDFFYVLILFTGCFRAFSGVFGGRSHPIVDYPDYFFGFLIGQHR